MKLAGVLLAAGRGTRMGTPKALLRWGADTFVTRAVRTWSAVCDPLVVVGGARFEGLREQVGDTVTLVFHPGFDRGMVTSVQAGLAALPGGLDGALVGPVDQPLTDSGLLTELRDAWLGAPDLSLVPEFQGRPGHPVLLAAGLWPAVAAAPEWSSLARILAERPDAVRRLPLDRPEILRNINTREEYRVFMAAALAEEQGTAL